MEKVFITMHDLSLDARVVYASDSILDVLGYPPHEVVGKSCFEYFRPDEVVAARKIHARGVRQDKAAMLIYCNLKRKDGAYSFCECIFSIVYDVFVAAISIHSNNSKSVGRALTAPVIRRVFSSSPNDPRYHMLTHLSSKFQARPRDSHEPRAALILNRFTRSLTILYASHALTQILDFTPEEAIGKSFYECISPHCLQDAVEALERAKENDSIAYLRFQWRDPRLVERTRTRPRLLETASTRLKRKRSPTVESEEARITKKADVRQSLASHPVNGESSHASSSSAARRERLIDGAASTPQVDGIADSKPDDEEHQFRDSENARLVDGIDDDLPDGADEVDEDDEVDEEDDDEVSDEAQGPRDVEAVISCTSDGLVVILRRARPMIPKPLHGTRRGVFASPFAAQPMGASPTTMPSDPDVTKGALMETIQQVAVFAWSLHQIGGEVILPEDTDRDSMPSSLISKNCMTMERQDMDDNSPSNDSASRSVSRSGSGSNSNGTTSTPATTVSGNSSESTTDSGQSTEQKSNALVDIQERQTERAVATLSDTKGGGSTKGKERAIFVDEKPDAHGSKQEGEAVAEGVEVENP